MIERVHEHIIAELQQNSRTDTIFVLTAIILNLLALGINAGVVSGRDNDATMWIIFFTFVCLVIVVNIVAEIGLIKGQADKSSVIKWAVENVQRPRGRWLL